MGHKARSLPEQPSSSQRDVRLRFFMGPTNLGFLRRPEQVMKEHPVVVHQRDYRFDVFGRPQSVAEAIMVMVVNPEHSFPQHIDFSFNTALPATSDLPAPSDLLQDFDSSVQDVNMDLQGCSIEDSATTTNPCPDNTDTTPQRGKPKRSKYWKTDYDKEKDRRDRLNAYYLATRTAITLVFSMDERTSHYLLHRSGGFLSYLVGHQDLESCARQDMTLEYLKSIGQGIGLAVSISKIRLSALDEDVHVWLQVSDAVALQAILEGITQALATDPLYSKGITKITKEEFELRVSWISTIEDNKIRMKDNADDDGWVTSRGKGKQKRVDWVQPGDSARSSLGGRLHRSQGESRDESNWNQTLAVHSASYDDNIQAQDNWKERRMPRKPKPDAPDLRRATCQSVQSFFSEAVEEPEVTNAGRGGREGWGSSNNIHSALPRGSSYSKRHDQANISSNGWRSTGTNALSSVERIPSVQGASGASASSSSRSPSPSSPRITFNNTAVDEVRKSVSGDVVTDVDVDEIEMVAEWASPDVAARVKGWHKEARLLSRQDRTWSNQRHAPPSRHRPTF